MECEEVAVWCRDLRARFGSVAALRGLSFDVARRERVAILGPNGAGKTTLLRVLSGALRASDGELRIAGLEPSRQPDEVRARLGVLSHQTYLFGELSALENLRFYGRLYCVRSLDERVAALLERVGLDARRDERVDALSRGLQQRLAIARSVLHDPPIVLLDEPDTGLDLSALQLLESLLLGAGDRTVVMATHNLEQARRLCDRALVLVDGRLVADLSARDVDVDRLVGLYRVPARVPR